MYFKIQALGTQDALWGALGITASRQMATTLGLPQGSQEGLTLRFWLSSLHKDNQIVTETRGPA